MLEHTSETRSPTLPPTQPDHAFGLVFIVALVLLGCDQRDRLDEKGVGQKSIARQGIGEKDVDQAIKPEAPAVATDSGCTVNLPHQIVDGSSLWTNIPDPDHPHDCNFHRFAYNNFLYMVGGDTKPRFLTELASTATLAKGVPFPGGSSLKTRSIENTPRSSSPDSSRQAGDSFELVDVGGTIDPTGHIIEYEVRVNETFWNYANQVDSKSIAASAKAFNKDPRSGGLWMPPNGTNTTGVSIEIKTSWRNFGTNVANCPSEIMFCETDSDGNVWGLLGLHLVQKTPTVGEWVWSSFEHVANAPDCEPGNSNPIQKNPRDPTNPSSTINVNSGELARMTGWTLFDATSYGDGTSCDFMKGTLDGNTCRNPSGTPQCNGDPTKNPPPGRKYKFVNICRTDPVPDHSSNVSIADVCKSTAENDNNVACLTQSVLDNWPADLDPRWKYYMEIGAEWLDADSPVQTVGCINIETADGSGLIYSCPNTDSSPPSYKIFGTTALANTTLETWMQDQMCQTYSTGATYGATECFGCHQPPTTKFTADFSHVF